MRWVLRAVIVLAGLLAGASGLPALVVFVGDTTLTTDDAMQAALKILFDDAIVNSAVTDSELLDYFEEGDGIQVDRTTGGRYIETAQMFALPSGFGTRRENGYIPVPGGPAIENGRVNLKKAMGSVEMSEETMKQVRTDIGSFIDWADRALPSLVERATNELDRMLIGYGAGVKARVNMAVPTTTLEVDSPMGIDGLGPIEAVLLQFLEGETLRAGPNLDGSGLRALKMKVQNVDFENGAIIVDQLATGLADNDYLAEGDEADNSFENDPMGLFGMVDDGDILNEFQGIDRSQWLRWRSYVHDSQGAPLTERLIIQVEDVAYVRSGARIDTLCTNRQSLTRLWDDIKPDRRLVDPTAFEVGKGPIKFLLLDRVVEVRTARKLPSVLFGLTKATFRKWLLHRWEWDTTTGSLWKQVTDGVGRKAAFYAWGSMFLECGNRDPQKNFRIENYSTVLS